MTVMKVIMKISAGGGNSHEQSINSAVLCVVCCSQVHIRLAHAQYAERDLDGALSSLRNAVQLQSSHKDARALHAHIMQLRSILRTREAARRKEAYKHVLR